MLWMRSSALLFLLPLFAVAPFLAYSQTNSSAPAQNSAPAATGQAAQPSAATVQDHSAAQPIASNAPRMSKQTRFEIIRDFETQLVYSRASFPLGTKGLRLKNGVITPSGEELRQQLALWGPAGRPGDPSHSSFVQIKDDHIHFEINGGPVHRKKWYQRVQISGANGPPVTGGPDQAQINPHGSFVDVYFDRYVPEMTAQKLRDMLFPVLDFNARNKEQAYLDTVPPKVKEAILAHHVLVGMNQEMVVHAKGKPPKKVRERDGETEYEEWIYGEPPQDVDFVRIVGDEVVRVEIMKVGGEKIVRTDKEVILDQPEREAKKQPEERPANAPSLRRPGEDSQDVPKPANGASPPPPMPPPDLPQPPGSSGPGDLAGTRR